MRDQNQLALDCLAVEERGENVIEYLKGRGFISPKATWERLQINYLGRYNRKNPSKGVRSMTKLTLDHKKKAVSIMLNGGDPLDYLRRLGISNAAGCWYNIKKKLKEVDPDLYERLQKRAPGTRGAGKQKKEDKPVKKTEPKKTEKKEEQKTEVVSVAPDLPKATVRTDDFIVCCIRNHSFGELYRDEKRECIDWRSPNGEEVSMSMESWKSFAADLPRALHLLGVV